MNSIELMLTGQIGMKEFQERFKNDPQLQTEIRKLVPEEAKNNLQHELWKKYSYQALAVCGYDAYEYLLKNNKFNGKIADNLNIFGTIRCLYCYAHPDIVCTKKYEDAFGLYLAVVKDCYDGLEVRHITNQIVERALSLKTKKARIAQAKQEIQLSFHVEEKNIPRWIQGPEWPMGMNSPMQYISKKRKGESVVYYFKDVDTNKMREVEQWY